MSEAHTPGPWAWTYDGSKDYSIGEADDPQANAVAHVYAWQRNYDKARANCALIAAAPDLLEARSSTRSASVAATMISASWPKPRLPKRQDRSPTHE